MSDERCPCLSGESYEACCGRFHSASSHSASSPSAQASAPTAEWLMRSRYSAFAVADAAYLLATWHPSTRPASLELDPQQQWRRLDILNTTRGGMLDIEGTVEFRAFYRLDGVAGSQHEVSRFVREEGRWLYLDGVDGVAGERSPFR